MRALCGAIIAAGALIGLGLITIGIGTRYQGLIARDLADNTKLDYYVRFRDLDTALMVSIVAALVTLVIGLGIAFMGLAYHHHRRHLEAMYREQPPRTTTSGERITV